MNVHLLSAWGYDEPEIFCYSNRRFGLGQQVALASDEALAQTKAAAVEEAAILPSGM
jgi:hypothetical protein